jgi:LPXTG-motif cell wall-anchored protein
MMSKTALRRAAAATTVFALAAVGVVVTSAPAYAATFTVTTTADAGPGSLRQAILDANVAGSLDTIDFALPGVAPWTITLTTDLPVISGRVDIDGPGSDALTVLAPNTVLEFAALADISSVDGLTLDTVNVTVASGIESDDAELTLTDVIADGFPEFGIVTDTTLTATDSSFSDNGDGGVYAAFAVAGATMTLTNVDVNNNFRGVFITTAATTGNLNFTNVEAYLNDDTGIDIETDGSDVYILSSALRENATGASIVMGDGAVRVVNTDAFDNGTQGYAIDVEDGSVFFNGSDTYDNGLVSSLSGGGAYLDLTDTSATFYGSTFTGNTGSNGGGLYFNSLTELAQVTIDNTTISGNTSLGYGGGVYVGTVGGALTSTSSFGITDSTIAGNTTALGGGGLYFSSFGNGVGAELNIQINATTIDDNEATGGDGGGVLIADLAHDAGSNNILTVDRSTISNNRAPAGSGGGMRLEKDGVSGGLAYIRFANSTVSGNSAADAGALVFEGPSIIDELAVTLANSTIVNNSSGVGVDDDDTALSIANSIVSNNGSLDLATDDGPLFVLYSNVRRPEASLVASLTAGTGNQVGVDPQLGPLAANGGPTLTHLPQPGSPVFDAGDPAFIAGVMTDQRGEARIITRLDLGSVESPFLLPATGATISPWVPVAGIVLLLAGGGTLVLTRRRRRRA